MQARIINDGGFLFWYAPRRFQVGSWSGVPPNGGAYIRGDIRTQGAMLDLNLRTGEYHVIGPKGKLP